MQREARVFALLLALSALGCDLAAPASGALVADGVGFATFEVRARSTDVVPVDVFYPAHATGAPVGVRLPAFVLLQGGFVEPRRYGWQAEALAREGFVVALPRHELDLAFFSIETGHEARRLLVQPPRGSLLEGLVDASRISVGGHSLGGVVATKLALAGGYRGLVIEASFPDFADTEALKSWAGPSLSLAGALDCSAPLDAVRAGWERLPAPTALQVLAGVTHFQFTDSEEKDLQRGCPPEVPLAEAHARIAASLAAFLKAVDVGGGVGGGLGEGALRAVPGAEVTTR